MTEPQSQTPAANKQSGIDINDALKILNARSSHEPAADDTGCPCHQHAPEEAKSMGQTIDFMKTSEEKDENSSGEPTSAADLEETRQKVEQERSERNVKIQEELRTMSTTQLLNAVMEAQRERVTTYREYDRGLETVLETGNMTYYPNICANATASFSVLSDTVNAIGKLLEEKKRMDLTKLLRKLQKHEGEKLNLTAALHLERLRERNEALNASTDARVSQLLQDGVSSLRTKVAESVEAINDVLEELRYVIVEEQEEETGN